MLKQSPKQTAIARKLRKADTRAEQLLWRWLRDRRFSAYKFRRQQPMGRHTLDFFCNEAKLNIELDGSQHGHPEHAQPMRARPLAGGARHQGAELLERTLRGRSRWCATPSGRRYRNARRSRCRTIAGPEWSNRNSGTNTPVVSARFSSPSLSAGRGALGAVGELGRCVAVPFSLSIVSWRDNQARLYYPARANVSPALRRAA
jgi:very-short-patch-repair endonuclease